MSDTPANAAANMDALLNHTAAIVAAYVGRNAIAASDIPSMIRSVHGGLVGASGGASPMQLLTLKPAVPVKKSVTPDHIVCLEDGKRVTMLKRYLRSRYGLSPELYREKWGLPHDYPMVAPNYAERRSQLAKKFGLGRKPRAKPAKKRTSRR
jgi:predicted transcriptional regulator